MRRTTGFARLPGGGRIAFAVAGSGPAVVLPAWWCSHVVEDWHFDPLRRFIEGLAARRMVVRYDRLGTGCPIGSGRPGRSRRNSRMPRSTRSLMSWGWRA